LELSWDAEKSRGHVRLYISAICRRLSMLEYGVERATLVNSMGSRQGVTQAKRS
jgi:hypothetical protein